MPSEKVLSIVVPSYNIERFIDRLMESLTAPALRIKETDAGKVPVLQNDYEILLVNDGSVDSTQRRAEVYAALYPDHVRVINKANGGHGSALNAGILAASGKYVRALDGDDWVDPAALSRLICMLKTQQDPVDAVICSYNTVNENTEEIQLVSYNDLQPDKVLLPEEVLSKKTMYPYHSMVWRTELLREHGILLDENCFYVDTEYILFPLPWVHSFRYFPEPVYQYRVGGEDQSVSRTSYLRNRSQLKRVILHLCQFFEEKKDMMTPAACSYILNSISWIHYTLFEALRKMEDHKQGRLELRGVDRSILAVSRDVYDSARPVVKAARLLGYSRIGTGISDLRNRFLR